MTAALKQASFCLLTLLAASCGCERKEQATAPKRVEEGPTPNIIMVMIDTLRADCLGCYGNTSGNTPNMDAVAEQGVLFEKMISAAPWTQPSIASFFCAKYPGVHKVINYAQAFNATFKGQEKVVVFHESFETMAERLKARGYATGAFVANPYILKEYGFGQGFDHFDSSFARNQTPGSVVNEAALSWIARRDTTKPFFAYLHYMDPHGPYDAEPRFLDPLLAGVDLMSNKRPLTEKQLKTLKYLSNWQKIYDGDRARHERLHRFREYWMARYQAGVRQADYHLGALIDEIKALGLWDEAYLIVTSDHGEALCEHDMWEHGWSVHHTDGHIPLILKWRDSLPAGRRVPQFLRSIDLMPTVLDQLALAESRGVQGTSMLPFLSDRPPTVTIHPFIEAVKLGNEQKGIYVGNYKFMVTPKTRWMGLYDIMADPYEQNNLVGQMPQRAQELTALLQDQVTINQTISTGFVPGAANLTPAQRARLKSLGYIDDGE